MKTLVLIRHAKSAWDDPDLPDIDRPLAPRGYKAATQIGVWLKSAGYVPDWALCSTAKRTMETWKLIAPSLPKSIKVEYVRELYSAVPQGMLNIIARAPLSAGTTLVLGHNPGMASFATWLAGSGDRSLLAKLHKKFPTGAVAVLQFDVARWSDIAGEGGKLVAFMRPRDRE